jgi:hypothetical protein
MEEIEILYRECLSQKIKIQICYRNFKDSYMQFRIDKFVEMQRKNDLIKIELKYFADNRENINVMIDSYKQLLIRFLLFKKKMSFLINTPKQLIDEDQLKIMIDDQQKMMGFVNQINSKISDDKIGEVYDFIQTKFSNKNVD